MPPLNTAKNKLVPSEQVELPGKQMQPEDVSKVQQDFHRLAREIFPVAAHLHMVQEQSELDLPKNNEEFLARLGHYFSDSKTQHGDKDMKSLAHALLHAKLGCVDSETPHYGEKLLLAHALATVADSDTKQAVKVLECLSASVALHEMGGTSQVGQQAWRAARILSHSSTGMKTLLSLQSDTSLLGDEHQALAKREALQIWLQAGHQLIVQAPTTAPIPNAAQLLAYAKKRTGSLTLYRRSDVRPALAFQAAAEVFERPDRASSDAKRIKAYKEWQRSIKLSSEPLAKRAVDDEQAFIAQVIKLFPADDPNETGRQRLRLARELLGLMPDTHREKSAVPFSESLQLARALAAATNGNASDALEALEHMNGPVSLHTLGGGSRHQQQAWRTARLLSQSTAGVRALLSMYDDPSLAGDNTPARMKREAFVMLLQTADHVMSKHQKLAGISVATALIACAKQLTDDSKNVPKGDLLALHALQAAAAVFETPGEIPENDAQVGAYFAWRQGLKEGGENSPADIIKSRMSKFLVWVQRAEQRAENVYTAFDPRRSIGMKKSPLTAMTYGAAGANLELLDEETKKLRKSVLACIDWLSERCRIALAQPPLAESSGQGQEPSEQVNNRKQQETEQQRQKKYLNQMLAALDFWKKKLEHDSHVSKLHFPTRLQRSPASKSGGSDEESPRPLDETALRSIEFKEFNVLSLDKLVKWNKTLDEMKQPLPAEAFDFSSLIATARLLENSSPIKPEGKKQNDFREALIKIIASPTGNNVRYFDGGWHGPNLHVAVNLAGISPDDVELGVSFVPLGKLVHGLFAFGEFGSNSVGGEFFIGIDARWSVVVGISGFGGIKFKFGSFQNKAGIGLGVTYDFEKSGPSGVLIRTRMIRNEDGSVTDSWRRLLIDVVEFMFDQAGQMTESKAVIGPEELWSRFSRKFFNEQDISVNWRDNDRLSHTVAVNGYAGLRIAVGEGAEAAYAGPALTLDYNVVPYARNNRIDVNGWLNVTELAKSKSTAGMVNLSTLVSAPAVGNPESHVRADPSSATIPGAPVLGVSFPFLMKGVSSVLRLVDDGGQLSPLFSRMLIEFADPVNFLSYVEALRPIIAPDEKSGEVLTDFLKKVKSAARNGNQYFGESRKLLPAVSERIAAYKDDIAGIQATRRPLRAEDKEEIERLNTEIFRLLSNQNSSVRSAFYVYEMNTNGYTDRGVPIGAQLTAGTYSLGERQVLQLTMEELRQAS